MAHHVVYVTDARYRPFVEVSAASIRWSSSDKVVVHVIDVDKPEIARRLESFPSYHGSRATYVKLLIPELLPEVDWALYVDADTLALGDVSEVFAQCDETKLIVGSHDPKSFNLGPDVEGPWLRERGLAFGPKAICAGVMLMNLRAMREEGLLQRCREFLDAYGTPPSADQTVLNYVCRGRIGELSREWGVFSMCPQRVDFTGNCILHYPQDLPWRRERLNKLMNDYVCLWHWFVRLASRRGTANLPKIRIRGWWWRRGAYLLVKHCPWSVSWSPYLKARLRPTVGLTAGERKTILSRWA